MRADRAFRTRLENVGQGHLADHFESLDERRRQRFIDQVKSLDLALVDELRRLDPAPPDPGKAVPMPYVAAGARGADGAAAGTGADALRRGRIAFALLAGGQASRLRLDGPKGTYPIGPRTDRSLFRILVEQIVRAGRDFGACPPLAVTTSASTDAAIRAFFEDQDCFGMPRDRLHFAQQGSLPAFDLEGRVVLAGPGRIFRNPDGHGGAIVALERSGILAEWAAAGIGAVCALQVDNPLLRVVDPDFIGRLLLETAPVATKIVIKTDPAEKVGVVARVGGRPAIVEYSEIGARAGQRDRDGQLTFRLGSIAVHLFDIEFLAEALQTPLPLHRANKQIPGIDGQGNPARIPGLKFERFLFDLFPLAEDLTVVETFREREYAPLKNAEGVDSPETVRAALEAEYRRRYAEAGVTPPDDRPLELSPLDLLA